MDASLLGAETQLMYVKFAARHGDWRVLLSRGFEPTETMKRLQIQMRGKYLAWKKRRDEEDEREAATPKFWFELEPGHWVRAKDEEAARAISTEFKQVSVSFSVPEDTRHFIDIDTSKTCSHCKLRRIDPGHAMCGNCIALGYER